MKTKIRVLKSPVASLWLFFSLLSLALFFFISSQAGAEDMRARGQVPGIRKIQQPHIEQHSLVRDQPVKKEPEPAVVKKEEAVPSSEVVSTAPGAAEVTTEVKKTTEGRKDLEKEKRVQKEEKEEVKTTTDNGPRRFGDRASKREKGKL